MLKKGMKDSEFLREAEELGIPEEKWEETRKRYGVVPDDQDDMPTEPSYSADSIRTLTKLNVEFANRITELSKRVDGADLKLTEFHDEVEQRTEDLKKAIDGVKHERKMRFDAETPTEEQEAKTILGTYAGPLLAVDAERRDKDPKKARFQMHEVCDDVFDALSERFGIDRKVLVRTSQIRLRPQANDVGIHFRGCLPDGLGPLRDILRRAMDTATAGEGSEFVPTEFGRQVIERVRLTNKIVANCPVFDMPRSPFQYPAAGADPTVYYVAENTGDTGSKIGASDRGTANLTWTARKLGTRVLHSYELDADSIVAMGPFITEGMLAAINDGIEYALVRGDESTGSTANINKTSGTPTTTAGAASKYLVCDGIHHFCIDGDGTTSYQGTSGDMATFNEADLVTIRAAMGRFGIDPSKIMHLLDVAGYYKFFNSTNFPSVVTLEKYGAQATIIAGELARIQGSPIVVSTNIPLTTDTASGEINAETDGTKSSITTVYRPGVIVGFAKIGGAQRVLVERDRDIETQQHITVVSVRFDVQFPYDLTNEDSIYLGYDID